MPFLDFTAGDVLTAANVDTMFRQGVMTFASSSARDTALSGVLAEGMYAFLEDSDRLTYYTGAAWVVVSSPWAAYTPALTNATIGNGSLDFRYRYAGPKTVHVRGVITFGSTSSVSGQISVSYPDSVSPDAVPRGIGHLWAIDDNGTDYVGTCATGASDIITYANSTNAILAATSATVPFTWATSDVLSLDIIFEIT